MPARTCCSPFVAGSCNSTLCHGDFDDNSVVDTNDAGNYLINWIAAADQSCQTSVDCSTAAKKRAWR